MISIITQVGVWLSHTFELALVTKATILLVVGLVSLRLTKKSRASVRYVLLAVVFVGLGLLPLAIAIGPEIPITVFPIASIRSANTAHPNQDSLRPSQGSFAPTPVGKQSVFQRWVYAIDLVWIGGTLAFFAPLAISTWRLRLFQRNGLPWLDQRERVQAIAAELGFNAAVEILVHENVVAPLTCGYWRHTIVFPADAQNWSSADFKRSLVHELQHIRRSDWAIQCVARMICAIYWFHPLIWITWRNFCLEAERTCDDAVVENGQAGDRTEYAAQLVGLARRMSTGSSHPVLSMAKRGDLSRRISRLLEGTQRRGRAGFTAVTLSLCGAVFLTLALAALRLVEQPLFARESVLAGGLPLYPGAKEKPEENSGQPSRRALNLQRISVREASAGKYETVATAPSVLRFYRQWLERLGTVTECTGGRDTADSVRVSPEALQDPRACRPIDFGEGETLLKAGTREDFFVVTVRQVGGKSEFTLVHVVDANPVEASPKKL